MFAPEKEEPPDVKKKKCARMGLLLFGPALLEGPLDILSDIDGLLFHISRVIWGILGCTLFVYCLRAKLLRGRSKKHCGIHTIRATLAAIYASRCT